MIKLNTIYGTKNDYFIVIIRNPKYKCYELYRSVWMHELFDFKYLLNECNPIFAFDFLSDARNIARKIIDGKIFQLDE